MGKHFEKFEKLCGRGGGGGGGGRGADVSCGYRTRKREGKAPCGLSKSILQRTMSVRNLVLPRYER
jgi:hypothetical protein